eukprot:1177761-Prorocentrum_minimum.AAC.2
MRVHLDGPLHEGPPPLPHRPATDLLYLFLCGKLFNRALNPLDPLPLDPLPLDPLPLDPLLTPSSGGHVRGHVPGGGAGAARGPERHLHVRAGGAVQPARHLRAQGGQEVHPHHRRPPARGGATL